jgi:hypothetical protein
MAQNDRICGSQTLASIPPPPWLCIIDAPHINMFATPSSFYSVCTFIYKNDAIIRIASSNTRK